MSGVVWDMISIANRTRRGNGDIVVASTDPQLDVPASDPKSAASFAYPTKLPTHSITIEFCDRVKFACFDLTRVPPGSRDLRSLPWPLYAYSADGSCI